MGELWNNFCVSVIECLACWFRILRRNKTSMSCGIICTKINISSIMFFQNAIIVNRTFYPFYVKKIKIIVTLFISTSISIRFHQKKNSPPTICYLSLVSYPLSGTIGNQLMLSATPLLNCWWKSKVFSFLLTVFKKIDDFSEQEYTYNYTIIK